jgi:hypothetical protein
MGNKVSPTDDESKSHHGPYLQKMCEVLKELKQSYVEEMYNGIKRIIPLNTKSGDLSQTEKDFWRAEYWCENKNIRYVAACLHLNSMLLKKFCLALFSSSSSLFCLTPRLYSILKVSVSPYHYYLLFDKNVSPLKPVWVYCIQNVENTESMTVISQYVLYLF